MPPAYRDENFATARLVVRGGAWRLNLVRMTNAQELVRLNLNPPQPEVEETERTVTLRFQSSFPCLGRERSEVALNARFEWEIFLRGLGAGAAQMKADLSGISVRSLDIVGGASGVDLRLGQPKGIVPIRIEGEAKDVSIHRPPGVGLRVAVRGDARMLTADGATIDPMAPFTWTSPNVDGAESLFDVTVSGGATRISIN